MDIAESQNVDRFNAEFIGNPGSLQSERAKNFPDCW